MDAARHVPLGVFHPTFNPTSVDVPRLIDRAVAGASNRFNLDGTRRSVFQFQEVFNGDPNFLQTFIRKSAAPGDTTSPNRDVLDFPMWFAMRQNLSANQSQNNWYDLRNATQDARDDGLAHNGSQSIGFVVNHDEGGVHLSNVAHAWVLLRPGQAYVYFRGNDFSRPGNTQFFLKEGRGDALGGLYGNIITRLVDIRNSYGRGNFRERFIDGGGVSGFSNVYAFERDGAMLVGLSSFTQGAGITSFDQRTMYTAFPPGTRLIELTGNAADIEVDPLNQIPELVVVSATDNPSLGAGRVTMRIPRNQNINGLFHGRGYVVYGLPRPVGTLSLSNVAQVLAPETPTPATNSTARLSAIDVITADRFTVTLSTQVVTLADGFVDHRAAGATALLKLNDGLDVNGNGVFDFPSSAPANATRYGFEQFLGSRIQGYVSDTSSRPGLYQQEIDATQLAEGYHYLAVRAFRHRGPGESEIYTDFRRTIYIDRLPPVSAVEGFLPVGGGGATRDLRVRSTDFTADSVHVLMNLPPAMTESQILAMLSPANRADQIDRDLFSFLQSGVVSGNHVATVVTWEITGNRSILRVPALSVSSGLGLGLGDLDANGLFSPADVLTFEQILLSNGNQFHPAADIAADGMIDLNDLRGLGFVLRTSGANQPTLDEYERLVQQYLYIPEPSAGLLTLLLGGVVLRRQRVAA